MTNFNRIYVWIALSALAFWCHPVLAQERVIRLDDIINQPDSAGTGNDSVLNPTAVYESPKMIVKVYPNPATHQLTLELPGDEKEYFILIAMDGRVIREFLNGGPVDISMIPRGTYFILLKDDPTRMKPVRLSVI